MTCQATARVSNPNGLHFRPASRIAEAAMEFPGTIQMKYRNRSADAQSVLDILSLAVPEGGVVFIESDRFDAPYIVEQIRQLTAGDSECS